MTDITINIKTGSENSEPKVTTTTDTTDNAKAIVPKVESPKVETPKAEMKEETALKQEVPKEEMKEGAVSEKPSTKEKSSGKDDAKEMDMTEEEHAKMGSEK